MVGIRKIRKYSGNLLYFPADPQGVDAGNQAPHKGPTEGRTGGSKQERYWELESKTEAIKIHRCHKPFRQQPTAKDTKNYTNRNRSKNRNPYRRLALCHKPATYAHTFCMQGLLACDPRLILLTAFGVSGDLPNQGICMKIQYPLSTQANSMRALSKRQVEILDLIQKHIERTGFPPTRAEIAAQLGFRSPNAAEEHLRAMMRKGVLEIVPGTSRGIRLIKTEAAAHPYRANEAEGSWLTLPLVGRVAAGSPILAQEHLEGHYRFDPQMFGQIPDYLLRVRGMSMRDAGILEGDLLAVRRSEQARNGQIVVARIGDEVTVKRFEKTSDCITLWPAHPDYTPIVLARAQEGFALEGIALGLLRKQLSLS